MRLHGADSAVVAGAGVIAEPASTARVEGAGSRDVLDITSRIWLVGLARDDSDAAEIVSVGLLDRRGIQIDESVRLRRNGTP